MNSQEIFGDELEIFAKKELQKEVVVPKTKGEILGMVIVESGWGSMLPTVRVFFFLKFSFMWSMIKVIFGEHDLCDDRCRCHCHCSPC